MKKRIVISSLFMTTIPFPAWGMGGRTGFDYGFTCTKCLDDSDVIEREFLRVTCSKETTRRGTPSDYADITGHEGQHVFHKGGCGKLWISSSGSGIGCEMTGERMVLSDRNQAIRRTFELHQRFGNKALAKRTLDLIDRWLPPDFAWKASHGRSESRERTRRFSLVFHETKSEEAWQQVLDVVEHGTPIERSNQITQQAGARPP